MTYVIGLGNPGSEYEYTRHNVGFLVLSHIQKKHSFSDWKKDKYLNAELSTGVIGGSEYTLVRPQTFMNLSGEVVAVLLKKDVLPDNMIIIYDDLAFPFGTLRIAQEQGDGGHNGIKSISSTLKDQKCLRIRIGIHSYTLGSTEKHLIDLRDVVRADFVLKEFRPDEREAFSVIAEKVVSILESIKKNGLAKTMTEINQRTVKVSSVEQDTV
jgi:PTH1 family peptidyl-tRNA hydrolase